jgi:hypothetical protein
MNNCMDLKVPVKDTVQNNAIKAVSTCILIIIVHVQVLLLLYLIDTPTESMKV